jgi:hypothetical protein
VLLLDPVDCQNPIESGDAGPPYPPLSAGEVPVHFVVTQHPSKWTDYALVHDLATPSDVHGRTIFL